MSNDLEILKQKFANFKKFISEHSQNKQKVALMEKYSDVDFLNYSFILVQANKAGKLGFLVDATCKELQIEDQHKEKVKRYYDCFIEYLSKVVVPADTIENETKKSLEITAEFGGEKSDYVDKLGKLE